MARFFSAFLCTEGKSRSKETQKGTRPISDNIYRTRLDVKGLIIWPRSRRREVVFAEQTREIPSRQDGSIFPAPVANQKTGFASSCLLADLAI